MSKKTSLLMFSHGIYPNMTGGAEIHLYYLCRNLAEQGHHVFVISPATKLVRAHSSKTPYVNIPFIRVDLKLWSKPFFTLSYIIKSLIKSFKLHKQVEIVHAHMAYPIPMVPAFLFSLITHKPYIVSCRGNDIRISSRNFFFRIFQIPFLNNAKKIIAVSEEISEILIRKYGIPKRKILVIRNAYDDRIIQELANIKLCTAYERSLHIINVANFTPEKDHITLLDGFKRTTTNIKGIRLLLVGDGSLRGQLEEFCTQQSIHDVQFLGRLTHRDALEYVANSDIFILTSVEEGMPNVIIEALALGKPIIATTVGGIPEVIKDGVNGLLIPPKSPKHVAKALERLLNDFELRRKIGKAAEQSVKDYTWSKIVAKYERVYETIITREKNL